MERREEANHQVGKNSEAFPSSLRGIEADSATMELGGLASEPWPCCCCRWDLSPPGLDGSMVTKGVRTCPPSQDCRQDERGEEGEAQFLTQNGPAASRNYFYCPLEKSVQLGFDQCSQGDWVLPRGCPVTADSGKDEARSLPL